MTSRFSRSYKYDSSGASERLLRASQCCSAIGHGSPSSDALGGPFLSPALLDRTDMNLTYAPLTQAERYRAQCIEWMCRFEPTLFVTFVFNASISPAEAQRKLEAFHMRMDRKLVGRAMLRKPHERSIYIATIEKPDTNIHIHALFKLTDKQRVHFGMV